MQSFIQSATKMKDVFSKTKLCFYCKNKTKQNNYVFFKKTTAFFDLNKFWLYQG